jgi:hypothetical protein
LEPDSERPQIRSDDGERQKKSSEHLSLEEFFPLTDWPSSLVESASHTLLSFTSSLVAFFFHAKPKSYRAKARKMQEFLKASERVIHCHVIHQWWWIRISPRPFLTIADCFFRTACSSRRSNGFGTSINDSSEEGRKRLRPSIELCSAYGAS